MGLREEKKIELRRQIVSTSLSLFGEHGLSATRVADIAARLKISEATFFNYFQTKQAVCEEAASDVISAVVSEALAGDGDLDEQLGELITGLLDKFTAEGPLVPLVRKHPEIMARAWINLSEPLPALIHRIEDAQARRVLRDDLEASRLAGLFLDTMLVTLTRGLSAELSDEELEHRLRSTYAVWRDGCVRRPRPRRAAILAKPVSR